MRLSALIEILFLVSISRRVKMGTRKQGSYKYYLSDLMRKIDNNEQMRTNILMINMTSHVNSHNPKNNNNNHQIENGRYSVENEELDQVLGDGQHRHDSLNLLYESETETEDETVYFARISSKSYCRPNYKNYKIKIGTDCTTLNYKLVECSGYCNSQSMISKNQKELRVIGCCTLKKIFYKKNKLYCVRRIESQKIENDFYKKTKDTELYELFKNSFSESSWTDEPVVYRNRKYGGYYTVIMSHNASCACEIL